MLSSSRTGISRRHTKKLKVGGINPNDIQRFQAKAKADAESTDVVFCNPNALNLTVQLVAPLPEKDSRNRKVIVCMGEMATVNITTECSSYVQRDPMAPNVLRIIPTYTRNTPRIWPKIDKLHPLSEEDSIYLVSYGYYVISVPSSLVKAVAPGEFVTLTDVSFEVFIPRDLPPGTKLSELSESQLAWTDEMVEKAGAVFYFRAKTFTSLSKKAPVSQRSLIKLYEDRGLITRWIDAYDVEDMNVNSALKTGRFAGPYGVNHAGETESEGEEDSKKFIEVSRGDAIKVTEPLVTSGKGDTDIKDEKGKVMFHNKYAYLYEPMRIDMIPYNSAAGVEDDIELFPVPGGNVQRAFLTWPVADRFISSKDEKDAAVYEAVKSRDELDIKLKSWQFTFSAWQRMYGPPSESKMAKEGKTLADYEATDGINLETPIRDELVSARVCIYNDTIERDFGILNKDSWTHFIQLYGNFFSGILKCRVDGKRTLQRMERLNTILAEHASVGMGGGGGGEEETGLAERNYDLSIHYRCGGILFDMREWVRKIGVPVSQEMALKLLPSMTAERNLPRVNDIKEIPTFNNQAVACLNEIRSATTCAAYIESGNMKVYVVFMPGRLNPTRMKIIEDIDDPVAGDQLMNLVVLRSQKYTGGIHDPSIESIQRFLLEERDDSLFPLLFGVCDITPEFYNNEASTVSKFLGIHDTTLLSEWLYYDFPTEGEDEGEMVVESDPPVGDNENGEDEDLMPPSQVLPGSMEDLGFNTVDPPQGEEEGSSRGTKRGKEDPEKSADDQGRSSKSVSFKRGTKTESTGGRKHTRRSSDRSRRSSGRR